VPKKSRLPETRVKKTEPPKGGHDWVIWAAWADRITFEEILEKSGFTEAQVIVLMRKTLKPGSFRLWRKRVSETSYKHRKLFKRDRKKFE
tara:strand:+ start:3840 stop:4109 length:270 start_codon:yes stop_codon:yes gene_type:complete